MKDSRDALTHTPEILVLTLYKGSIRAGQANKINELAQHTMLGFLVL